MPKKEHSGTFKISNFLPENRLKMEHSELLILPDYVCRLLRRKCQAACKILTENHAKATVLNQPSWAICGVKLPTRFDSGSLYILRWEFRVHEIYTASDGFYQLSVLLRPIEVQSPSINQRKKRLGNNYLSANNSL